MLQQRPELVDIISLQSKCSIRFEQGDVPKHYDLSPEWIQASINGILQRLNIEQLDMLMLHRPDPLWEPEFIAESVAALIA